MGKPSVAVLLPAYNEEDGLGPVIKDFRKALPDARIVVCDNNSSDKTSEVALAAGAELYTQPLPGKGHAMRRLFREVVADIYIMCDADGSYDVSAAPMLVDRLASQKLDMIVAARDCEADNHRSGHAFGNKLFTWAMGAAFGKHFTDDKLPSAVLAAALAVGAALSFTCGVILDTVKRLRIQQKMQAYLDLTDTQR